MSKFLGEKLKQYLSIQKEWKLEQPVSLENILVGYVLMNMTNQRRLLTGAAQIDENGNVILPLDLLKIARNKKIVIIIGAGEKLFIADEHTQWEWGTPFLIKSVEFIRVNVSKIKAREITTAVVTEYLPVMQE